MNEDKLNFAKNYRIAETKIKSRKKVIKESALAFGLPSIFAALLMLINPWAVVYFIFAGALFGFICITANYYNCRDIENCNAGNVHNFTYKEFKQMKKSGELQQLIEEINKQEQEEAAEAYKAYLEFVKGKSYTWTETYSTIPNKETEITNENDNTDNV